LRLPHPPLRQKFGIAIRLARTLIGLFGSLDFVYLPSRDVERDVVHFTDSLGGTLAFAIEAFGTRVAMVKLTADPPAVLLAGHLEGDQPVLVYRVTDLEQTINDLEHRGVEVAARFGIPHGPGVELVMPGPQRIALYELTRPEAPDWLAGRRDF
jgi:hypothetical protein